jgi:hypothetical protein
VGIRKRQSWQQSHRHDRKAEAGIITRRSPHFRIPQPTRGARNVADGTMALFGTKSAARLVLAEVNGETGIVVALRGRPFAVLVLTVREERIAAIYAIVDPAKRRHVHAAYERGKI